MGLKKETHIIITNIQCPINSAVFNINMIKNICVWFNNKNKLSIQETVIKLKEVCHMQEELIQKYENQINVVKRTCIQKKTKQEKLFYMKKIKIIQYHRDSMRKRLLACTEKQYHLESIQLTVAHLDAIKVATTTLKNFMKDTDVQKVEELQENMSDLIADACEIQNIVSEDINQDHSWSDEELEKELKLLDHDDTLFPEVPLHTPSQSIDIEMHDTDVSTPLMVNKARSNHQNEQLNTYV
jgi:charged multivesicular body protein 5